MQLAKVLGTIGRVFITAGVLILLFVAYQLWGTGIREA
jgi:sortase A